VLFDAGHGHTELADPVHGGQAGGKHQHCRCKTSRRRRPGALGPSFVLLTGVFYTSSRPSQDRRRVSRTPAVPSFFADLILASDGAPV
jgi:hypothetical protein